MTTTTTATTPIAGHIRRLWLAGADTDAIARAIGTHRAAVAQQLTPLSDAELIAGVRAHLAVLIESRAPQGRKGKVS